MKGSARRKVFGAFSSRLGVTSTRDLSLPALMIHAVSLGEINATRSLVQMLKSAKPDLQFIISTTTETGFARAQELYGLVPDMTIVRYPLDFSPAVNRLLDSLRPTAVALMELELWPNFLKACEQRGVPVVLVNGRLSDHSFDRYQLVRPLVARMLKRLAAICVQEQVYADRVLYLGALPERVAVTGTMKFDTAQVVDRIEGDEALATAVGLWPGAEPIWVCGSTGPGEETILLDVYRALLERFSRLRLVIVPRKPERFDAVAKLIESHKFRVIRRSNPGYVPPNSPIPAVILGDTMGELRKFYSLASIVFVGRSIVDLGPRQRGSDMIEPAALARPIVVGQWTHNFAEPVKKLLAAEAMLVAPDGEALFDAMTVLLSTPLEAASMARRAREVVVREQGATLKHARLILRALERGVSGSPLATTIASPA